MPRSFSFSFLVLCCRWCLKSFNGFWFWKTTSTLSPTFGEASGTFWTRLSLRIRNGIWCEHWERGREFKKIVVLRGSLPMFFLHIMCRYIGRKALNYREEAIIPGTENLVRPSYSYWTLSYLLSQRGAKKLIEGEPFGKLLPVDEYIPIMFNRHPEYVCMTITSAQSVVVK